MPGGGYSNGGVPALNVHWLLRMCYYGLAKENSAGGVEDEKDEETLGQSFL